MIERDGESVLIVEDDMVCRKKIAVALSGAGFLVEEAVDGIEGWAAFEGGIESQRFSLLITDVEMPGMDGLELTQRVRKAVPDLPVVVLTAHGDKQTIKEALRVGANEFLEKPLSDPREIVDCVCGLIEETPNPYERERLAETAEAVRRVQETLVGKQAGDSPFRVYSAPLKDAGGDTFWQCRQSDGSYLFALADVAGHSVDSSYVLASFLGALATHQGDSSEFGSLIAKINADIRSGPFPEIPVSALLGKWYPESGILNLANVGLPFMWVYRRHVDEPVRIRLQGTPLGLFEAPQFDERVVLLRDGDRMLLSSDGLLDALSPNGEPFELLAGSYWGQLKDQGLDEALAMLHRKAVEWTEGRLVDDVLIVGFEQARRDQAPVEVSLTFDSTIEEVDVACQRVRAFLEAPEFGLRMGERSMFDLLLAVREALLNGIKHGNRGRSDAKLRLECWRSVGSGFIHFAVIDEGEGLEVGLDAGATSTGSLEEGGRGLSLMRRLSHGIKFAPGRVELTFKSLEGE